jgi:hypothetical protein
MNWIVCNGKKRRRAMEVEWVVVKKEEGRLILQHGDVTATVDRNLGLTLKQGESDDSPTVRLPDYVGAIKALRALDRVVTEEYGEV